MKQYSDIVAIDSLHLNGEFTLGENIGDLGGVQAAYEGLQIFLNKTEDPKILMGLLLNNAFSFLGELFGEPKCAMKL